MPCETNTKHQALTDMPSQQILNPDRVRLFFEIQTEDSELQYQQHHHYHNRQCVKITHNRAMMTAIFNFKLF